MHLLAVKQLFCLSQNGFGATPIISNMFGLWKFGEVRRDELFFLAKLLWFDLSLLFDCFLFVFDVDNGDLTFRYNDIRLYLFDCFRRGTQL